MPHWILFVAGDALDERAWIVVAEFEAPESEAELALAAQTALGRGPGIFWALKHGALAGEKQRTVACEKANPLRGWGPDRE